MARIYRGFLRPVVILEDQLIEYLFFEHFLPHPLNDGLTRHLKLSFPQSQFKQFLGVVNKEGMILQDAKDSL